MVEIIEFIQQKNQEQKIRIEQQILNNNASHTRKM